MTSPFKQQQSQKHFNKSSAQKGSVGKEEKTPAQQSGNKYYQSRYIYQQSPVESVQTPFQRRNSSKNVSHQSQVLPPKSQIEPQQQQFDLNDQMMLQTPVTHGSQLQQSSYVHNRTRSDYNQSQQPPSETDLQIDMIIELLLSDETVLQSLNAQYKTPGADKLRVGSKLREAVGLILQQSAGPRGQQSQYSQLKNEYMKLQQEFSRKLSDQAERIQSLQNQVAEKEEMLIRESKTRQMLENQNQEYCRRISDVTGDYHNKLQMKEEVFYQKGQECYNEINILKRTIVELQQKIVDEESYMQHQEAEILKIQDKSNLMIEEKDSIIHQIKSESFQLRKNLEKSEMNNVAFGQLIEELRQQLQQSEMSRQAIDTNLRVILEEKKKEQESYELLLKQKEAEKCLEANDLISAINHLRDERMEDNAKHKSWIDAIQNQVKGLNQKKYDLVQLLYNQKNYWQGLMNAVATKMADKIKANAVWYRKIVKDKDNAMIKFKREKEKEINDLNQRWQDVVDSQDKVLHNEFQTELLSQSGKFEQKLLVLQGQVNDYSSNYMQTREHKELIQQKEMNWTDERDKLWKAIGELESAVEDLEWKLQKTEKELGLSSDELVIELKKKQEIQLKLNDCDKRRITIDGKLKNEEFLHEKLKADVQELLVSLDAQIGKNEKDLEIKKKLEEQLLIRRQEIQQLDEDNVQRNFEIKQDTNLINKREIELEQKDKEIKQKENEINNMKGVIDQQDVRIRTMELNERDDLNEYYNNCRLNNDIIESQWKAKKDLWRNLQDTNYEHLKGFDKVQMQKKKVVEELFAMTWQLRQRDRELKHEQRTVESLLANKKKLSQIIEDLNQKIEQLNDKIEDLSLNLRNVKEERQNIINKFKEFKLQQLKQKKFQLVQTKKFMQELQKEYMNYGYEVDQVMKQSNSDLQTFVVSVEANLKAFTTQHEDELNQLRMRLDQDHQDTLSAQLFQEKERSRVQLDSVKQTMGEQIVQLGEQLQILKKKLSHTGQNNSQLGQELGQSQNVMRFADQEIFDVRQRYKTIKGELDTIVSESKGKYETIEQEHQNTVYGKQQMQQLKHFTDIQNTLSSLLLQLEELLRKYIELDQQKEKDLKNSQAMLQTKILSSSRLVQSKQSPKKESTEIDYQMTDSFSPTQYAMRVQKEQEVIKEEEEDKKILKTQKI